MAHTDTKKSHPFRFSITSLVKQRFLDFREMKFCARYKLIPYCILACNKSVKFIL